MNNMSMWSQGRVGPWLHTIFPISYIIPSFNPNPLWFSGLPPNFIGPLANNVWVRYVLYLHQLEWMSNFRRAIEHQLCKYSDMTSACNETRAQQYAFYYQTDIDIWRSSSCGTLLFNSMVHAATTVNCVVILQTEQQIYRNYTIWEKPMQ